MFAWLAAIFFTVAALVSGGGLQPGTAWLHPDTLIALGLVSLALFLAGMGPEWGRRP